MAFDRRKVTPRVHDILMVLCFILTGLLERNVIPAGNWREVAYLALGVLTMFGVKVAQRWMPTGTKVVPVVAPPPAPPSGGK